MKLFWKIALTVLIVLFILAVVGWVTGASDFNADLLTTTNTLKTVIDVINSPLMMLGRLVGADWLITIFDWFPFGWISKGLGAIGGLL